MFSKTANNRSPSMKKKTPLLYALLSLALVFSSFVACKDDDGEPLRTSATPPVTPPVSCPVGDDSPCELWQRCVDQGNHQGHCVGERQCETNDNCSNGKTCKGSTCVPSSNCEIACPPGKVCVNANCKTGCFDNSDCSDNRICGGHDAETGLGACRNPRPET